MCVAFLADLFQKSRFEETAIYMYPVIKLIFTIFNIIKIKHVVFCELASIEINYCEYFQNPFRKERHIFI